MSDMFQEVSIEDIAEIYQTIPVGRYTVRLTQCEGVLSKAKGLPMLVATYEIMDGQSSGLEAKCYYTLTATPSKNGKSQIAYGLQELKKIFAAIGKPLPKDWKWQLGRPEVPQSTEKSLAINRKLFLEKIGQTRLEMNVVTDGQRKDKDTGELKFTKDEEPIYNYRYTIIGPAVRSGGTSEYSSVVAPASSPTAVTSASSEASHNDELLAMLERA